MTEQEIIYAKADPKYIGLDRERGGDEFAQHLLSLSQIKKQAGTIVLDLSGNVRLDYLGCSVVLDACIDILSRIDKSKHKTIVVITAIVYEMKEPYAWLFFKKSRLEKKLSAQFENYSDLAVTVCNQFGIQFNIYQVPLRFRYLGFDELDIPNFVLSSK